MFKPTRVVVGDFCDATTFDLAANQDIWPDVVFKRDDDWTLGAPKQYAYEAHRLYKKNWVEFAYWNSKELEWFPISEYKGV